MNNKVNLEFPHLITGVMNDFCQTGINKILEEGKINWQVHQSAPVNISESEKAYTMSLIAPGLKKTDLKVTTENNLLTITYDHTEKNTEAKAEKILRTEYPLKSFKRSFTLNEKMDASQISAQYTDGILILNIPKKDSATWESKEIKIA